MQIPVKVDDERVNFVSTATDVKPNGAEQSVDRLIIPGQAGAESQALSADRVPANLEKIRKPYVVAMSTSVRGNGRGNQIAAPVVDFRQQTPTRSFSDFGAQLNIMFDAVLSTARHSSDLPG